MRCLPFYRLITSFTPFITILNAHQFLSSHQQYQLFMKSSSWDLQSLQLFLLLSLLINRQSKPKIVTGMISNCNQATRTQIIFFLQLGQRRPYYDREYFRNNTDDPSPQFGSYFANLKCVALLTLMSRLSCGSMIVSVRTLRLLRYPHYEAVKCWSPLCLLNWCLNRDWFHCLQLTAVFGIAVDRSTTGSARGVLPPRVRGFARRSLFCDWLCSRTVFHQLAAKIHPFFQIESSLSDGKFTCSNLNVKQPFQRQQFHLLL